MTEFFKFSTLVMVEPILSQVQVEVIAKKCLELNTVCKAHPALTGNSYSSYSTENFNILNTIKELDGCGDVDHKIIEVLRRYGEITGIAMDEITGSWFNVQQPQTMLMRHNHAGAMVAGALYIQTNEHASPIVFDNPNPWVDYIRYNEPTEFTVPRIEYRPRPGDLVLFPSYLYHGSGEYLNQMENRIVVSFNVNCRQAVY